MNKHPQNKKKKNGNHENKNLNEPSKHPCKDLIKRIIKINDGEAITLAELEDLRDNLELFPQCRKYLNAIGLELIKN